MEFVFSSRRRHTTLQGDWSSDVCSSDLDEKRAELAGRVIDAVAQQKELARRLSQIDVSDLHNAVVLRSEERRVGKEGGHRGARGHPAGNGAGSGDELLAARAMTDGRTAG